MHMFAGTIKKGISIKGYVKNNLVETGKISKRHDELAKELLARGFLHKTPLNFNPRISIGKVNENKNMIELSKRCVECRKKIRLQVS
jgi:hypothetical protein